jgi:DNA-binding CsgD family transcriptional regulator
LWFKEYRRLRTFELFDLMDEFQAMETDTKTERDILLMQNLQYLSASCREVMALILLGCSEEKISETLNLGGARVAKNKKYYCKERLKDLILIDPLFEELYG